jgi:hypothetical protein
VIAWLENPLGAENGPAEMSLETDNPKRLYTARTLVQDQQEVLSLNATLQDQTLTKGSHLAHCDTETLVT